MSKKRIIYGIAYNALTSDFENKFILDANKTIFDINKTYSRDEIYNHPQVRLNKDKDNITFDNKPIYLEHDKNNRVGTICCSWVDDDKIKIIAEVYGDDNLMDGINSGEIGSLSVGYVFDIKNQRKTINEVSLCREPFFEGCQFSVAASKRNNKTNFFSDNFKKNILLNKSNDVTNELRFLIVMASQNEDNSNENSKSPSLFDGITENDLKKIITELQNTKTKLDMVYKEKEQYEIECKKNRQSQYNEFISNYKKLNGVKSDTETLKRFEELFLNSTDSFVLGTLHDLVNISNKNIAPKENKTFKEGNISDLYKKPQQPTLNNTTSNPDSSNNNNNNTQRKRTFSEVQNDYPEKKEEPEQLPIAAHKRRRMDDDDVNGNQNDDDRIRRFLKDMVGAPSLPSGATKFPILSPTTSKKT